MKQLDIIAAALLVIGGLNWGLVGLADVDLVQILTAGVTAAGTIVYALVGVAAVYQVAALPWIQKRWNVTPRLVSAA